MQVAENLDISAQTDRDPGLILLSAKIEAAAPGAISTAAAMQAARACLDALSERGIPVDDLLSGDSIAAPVVPTALMTMAGNGWTDLIDASRAGDDTLSPQERKMLLLKEFEVAWQAMMASSPEAAKSGSAHPKIKFFRAMKSEA